MREATGSFFRTIIENAKSTMWVISGDGSRIEFVNRDFCGLPRERLCEEGPSAVWQATPDIHELNALLRAINRATTMGERTESIQARHRNILTGSEEYYLHSIYPLCDPRKVVTHIQMTSRDITHLLEARKTLEILGTVNRTVQENIFAENLFGIVGRRLARHGLFVVILIARNTRFARIEYTNFPKRKFARILGLVGIKVQNREFSLERFPAVKWTLLRKKAHFFESPYDYLRSRVLKGNAVKHMGTIVGSLGLGKIIIAPMVVNRRSIGLFVMSSASLSEMDMGTVSALAVQFAHVIVHRQIYRDAGKLTIHLETLLENVSEAVFTTDREGVIVSWNRAARQLFGHEKKDIIGKNVESLGVPESLWHSLRDPHGREHVQREKGISLARLHGGTKVASITTFPTDREGQESGTVFIVRELSGSV